MSTTQPIRNLEHVRALCGYYLELGEHRNHRLVLFCLHTALRISDILPIRWQQVYDFPRKCVRKTFTIVEKKTGKNKTIALNENLTAAIESAARGCRPNDFLFANTRTGKPISRTQAYRIIRAAGESLNLPRRISCHSLRKTFGYHAWKTGISPAVIMEIYNHSSLKHTRRYLGVHQDDLNRAYLCMNFAA